MAQQFFNNFDTTLSVQVEIVDTSMTVNDATGLPVTLGGGNSYLLTLSDGPVETLWEIVLVTTDRAGNVITMARAQEGSSALVWPIGTFVSARVTAATMDAAIAAGGGGGGSGTELVYDRRMFWVNDIVGDNQGDLAFSKDGGYTWDGSNRETWLALGPPDQETPKLALGSGINCKGITVHATATL